MRALLVVAFLLTVSAVARAQEPSVLPAGNAGAASQALVGREPWDHYRVGIEQWRQRRLQRLTRPEGWLALIGRHPLEQGAWTVGSAADNAIRLAAGPARWGTVTNRGDGAVSFAISDGVDSTIDGTTARQAPLATVETHPTYVRAGTVNFYVMERGGKLFLRVRDTEATRRVHFAGIENYPIDPAWRIEARWVAFTPPRETRITNIVGFTEPVTIPGKAVFEHDGKSYELQAIDEGPDEELFFVLTDTTAGTETYEASRFVYAPRPVADRVVLDFNKLYNPPCAFTPFSTCPLPPAGNALPFPIRAGEKKYRGPE